MCAISVGLPPTQRIRETCLKTFSMTALRYGWEASCKVLSSLSPIMKEYDSFGEVGLFAYFLTEIWHWLWVMLVVTLRPGVLFGVACFQEWSIGLNLSLSSGLDTAKIVFQNACSISIVIRNWHLVLLGGQPETLGLVRSDGFSAGKNGA